MLIKEFLVDLGRWRKYRQNGHISLAFSSHQGWTVSKIVEIGEFASSQCRLRSHIMRSISFQEGRRIQEKSTPIRCVAVATTMITIARSSSYIRVLASVPCSMFNRPLSPSSFRIFFFYISYFFLTLHNIIC